MSRAIDGFYSKFIVLEIFGFCILYSFLKTIYRTFYAYHFEWRPMPHFLSFSFGKLPVILMALFSCLILLSVLCKNTRVKKCVLNLCFVIISTSLYWYSYALYLPFITIIEGFDFPENKIPSIMTDRLLLLLFVWWALFYLIAKAKKKTHCCALILLILTSGFCAFASDVYLLNGAVNQAHIMKEINLHYYAAIHFIIYGYINVCLLLSTLKRRNCNEK